MPQPAIVRLARRGVRNSTARRRNASTFARH
jgi:hypothetical protein